MHHYCVLCDYDDVIMSHMPFLHPWLQRAVVSISREAEANITRILNDVRRESQTDSGVGSWQQSQQLSTSNPGPSISWGLQGACGVGQPSGQESMDSVSLASASYSRQPVVAMQVYTCTCTCMYTYMGGWDTA